MLTSDRPPLLALALEKPVDLVAAASRVGVVMSERDEYRDLLSPHLGQGFEFKELVIPGSNRHAMPPRPYWPNMLETLKWANAFRRVALVETGAKGLRVAAAYRPSGGASRSAHKTNSALDLDIIGGSPLNWYSAAVDLWAGYVNDGKPIGLGLYCSPRALGGIRIHIDCTRARTWQHHGNTPVRPPAARRICESLGIPYPLGGG